MRKLFLILMTLCAVSWSLMAQTRTYSGSVVDAGNNEPLIGATIMPIGGGQGTATDVDGNFTLTVPANVKSVKVTYVGYKEQTVALHDKMVVHLASTSTNLDDVVVVAYGTASKESLTGSVAVVGSEEIDSRPVTNVTTALEGSAPGVSVNNSTGYPGSSPQIRIRGFNSFNGAAQAPLYVVDGIIYNGDISDINPADVESMSVLKDAASCALYGSRGANGVILITTKKAKGKGKVNVNLQVNVGAYQVALPQYDKLGADQWMEASLMGAAMGNLYNNDYAYDYATAISKVRETFMGSQYISGANVYGTKDENGAWVPVDGNKIFDENGKIAAGVAVLPGYTDLDWWKAISQTGTRQEYNLNAAGASDNFDAFASVGYLNQKGYIVNSGLERFTGRFTANYSPVNYFRTGMNLAASYTSGNNLGTVSSSSSGQLVITNQFRSQLYAPINAIYEHDAAGNIIYDNEGKPVYSSSNMNKGGNLIQSNALNRNDSKSITIDGSIYGTAVLPYGFEATVRGGMYRSKTDYNIYSNNQEGSQKGVGGLSQEFDDARTYMFSQSINWSQEYGLNHVDVLLHHENNSVESGYKYYSLSGQMLDKKYTANNFSEVTAWDEALTGYNTESYLGRARYNYDQKYFGEFSINRDGTSQFAKDKRWGTFWSVGAGWIISKEKFMQDLHWLNYLKLRLAYGSTGNNQACSYINYLTMFSTFPYGNGIVLSKLANDDLKWEATETLDVALEGSLFNDRFRFAVGFYDKRNADLIYSLPLPWSNGTLENEGYVPSVTTNVGEMQNYGWELQFGVDIIRNSNVVWDFNVDASINTNKIKKLPYGKDIAGSALFQGRSRYVNYTYDWAGVDMTNGRSLYYMNPDSPDYWKYNANDERYYDKDAYQSNLDAAIADGSYVEIDGVGYTYNPSYAGRKIMGDKIPKVYGSFGSNVSWKGLHAGVLFTYSIGGKIMDSTYNSLMRWSSNGGQALHKDVLKSWTQAPEGMTADSPNRIQKTIPQFSSADNIGSNNTYSSSQYLTDASFLSLKNVNVSYDLPSKWVKAMKLENINIGFMMENVFITSKRKGLNSQSAMGSVPGSVGMYYMPARTYTFQLAVRF